MLVLAAVAAFAIALSGIAALIRAGRRTDRILSTLALFATLATLVLATAQNQEAARYSLQSSNAAQQSASLAAQALTVQLTPALTITISQDISGKENAFVPITPNKGIMTVEQPWSHSPFYDYVAIIVHNFGQQPILAAQLPLRYGYDRIVSPGHSISLGTKTCMIDLSGIPAQGSYVIWVANESVRLTASVVVPQSISFFEPSLPGKRINYTFPTNHPGDDVVILNPMHLPPSALNNPHFQNLP